MKTPSVYHVDQRTGVPRWTAHRLTQDFLKRHGGGLEDLLKRFPNCPGRAFHDALQRSSAYGETTSELADALAAAIDTLLALKDEYANLLPVDAGHRENVDVGLQWYAARFRDLSWVARTM